MTEILQKHFTENINPSSPICTGCGCEIRDPFILRVSPNLEWHASCLKCMYCDKYLDETCTCYFKNGKAYCKRDYLNLYGIKCSSCGMPLSRTDLVMKAKNLIYHTRCFQCYDCRKTLLPGEEFVVKTPENVLFCRKHVDMSSYSGMLSVLKFKDEISPIYNGQHNAYNNNNKQHIVDNVSTYMSPEDDKNSINNGAKSLLDNKDFTMEENSEISLTNLINTNNNITAKDHLTSIHNINSTTLYYTELGKTINPKPNSFPIFREDITDSRKRNKSLDDGDEIISSSSFNETDFIFNSNASDFPEPHSFKQINNQINSLPQVTNFEMLVGTAVDQPQLTQIISDGSCQTATIRSSLDVVSNVNGDEEPLSLQQASIVHTSEDDLLYLEDNDDTYNSDDENDEIDDLDGEGDIEDVDLANNDDLKYSHNTKTRNRLNNLNGSNNSIGRHQHHGSNNSCHMHHFHSGPHPHLPRHHHLNHHTHNRINSNMGLNHHQSHNHNSNNNDKVTRVRTVLNEKQLHTLRTCYNANPRPDALMKEQLVEMTGLSPRVIRVWFQNKRCKDKKRQILMKQISQAQEKGISNMHGIPLIATSPVRHEHNSFSNNFVEIQSYQTPWKALNDFAIQNDMIESQSFQPAI
ncbi:unnamed protein product [Gordionus sp. m RMFG-2023]|uniref:GATA zinc finger domain-containing protein 14-like n=1 Tax=Gordionus sp. m RMFG-2023 TaxID=3053472 RepID=UPI0030DE6B54